MFNGDLVNRLLKEQKKQSVKWWLLSSGKVLTYQRPISRGELTLTLDTLKGYQNISRYQLRTSFSPMKSMMIKSQRIQMFITSATRQSISIAVQMY